MMVSPFSSLLKENAWAFPVPGRRKKRHHETAVGLLFLVVLLTAFRKLEKIGGWKTDPFLKYSLKLTVCSWKSKAGGFLIFH